MAERSIFHKLTTWVARAVHRKGFGVQSPWAYELVRDVFFEPLPYYAFKPLREQALSAKSGRKTCCHYEQLFRIANYLHPASIVEINNGCPASMLYLSSPHSDVPSTLITSAAPQPWFSAAFRGETMVGGHLSMLQSLFSDGRCIDLLHIGHTDEAESVYYYAAEHTDDESVIILEDFGKNARLWKKIVADKRAVITFDFYDWGMIVFDSKRQKQNYLL